GRTAAALTGNAYHSRCSPPDNTSVIRSKRGATELKTRSTCAAFWSSATRRNPKCVVRSSLIAHASVSAAAMAGGLRGLRRRRWIPTGPGSLQALEILRPQVFLAQAELIEQVPRIDAGTVAVGKRRLQPVVADRLGRHDRHIPLADLQLLLAGTVPAHLGRGRVNAQEFVRQPERAAVAERDLQHARVRGH